MFIYTISIILMIPTKPPTTFKTKYNVIAESQSEALITADRLANKDFGDMEGYTLLTVEKYTYLPEM